MIIFYTSKTALRFGNDMLLVKEAIVTNLENPLKA